MAIQAYLAAVNSCATDTMAAARSGLPAPRPELVLREPRRLPLEWIYRDGLPPLKKVKTKSTADTQQPAGGLGFDESSAMGAADQESLQREADDCDADLNALDEFYEAVDFDFQCQAHAVTWCLLCYRKRKYEICTHRAAIAERLRRLELPSHTGGGAAEVVVPHPFPPPVAHQSGLDAARSVRIATDGSYMSVGDDRCSGWGFTVARADAPYLADFCGPISVSPLHPHYVGASRHSNNVAEVAAILFACRYIVSAGISGDVSIEYDSDYAAGVVRRRTRPSTHFTLVINARAALDFAATRARITWIKVESHTGHFLNERADQLAKHATHYQLARSTDAPVLTSLFSGQHDAAAPGGAAAPS